MKRIVLIAIIFLIFSAILGWMRAGTSAGPQAADLSEWVNPNLFDIEVADYEVMGDRIRATKLFPVSDKQAAEDALKAAQLALENGLKQKPAFPKIGGASGLNEDAYTAHLILDDGKLLNATEGVKLENGWHVKSISRTHLVASYDGEEEVFPIIDYLDAAYKEAENTDKNVAETPK